MALILKQEANANVTTPPAGSGAVFLNASDQLTVKDSAGNTSAIPTFTATNNTAVFFNDAGALGENANLTFVKTTNTLTVLGNVNATGVKTDNLYYANGNPWDLSDPGGSNTQIQFNDDESFGGSANFVWDKSSNTLVVNGTSNVNGTFNVAGNITANNVGAGNLLTANFFTGTLTTNAQPNITSVGTLSSVAVTGNTTAGNVYANSGTIGASLLTGTLTTAAQPNITSVGTLTTLTTSGNAIIGGNLIVNGNITYVNVENFSVEDPIISIGGGANGDPLTTNDGKDRGTALQYYTSAPVTAFMGWDNGNGEFAFGSNVSIASDVVTYTTLGNVRASTLLGNISGTTGDFTGNITSVNANLGNVSGDRANFTGNISGANANLGNVVTGNYFTGVLTYAAQPNITSVGTLTSLQIGATSDKANDFPNATTVSSQDNSGDSLSAPIGLVGEAVANSSGNVQAFGLYGVARANGAAKGTGIQGTALVTNTADTGAAVGVRGYATATHSGGYNIGVLGNAIGSGVGNYAFYVQNGGIASIENATFWDLNDNSNAALTFNSTGKANIFGIETTDNAEGIFTSGYLNVTGNVSAGGVKTNNYYYANGSPVDFQQAGGSNTQVQFNDADGFGGSAAFTFNKTSNLVSMGGALSVTGNANVGNIGATNGVFTNVSGNGSALSSITGANVTGTVATATTAGTVTTAAQPNITSVGTLTSLAVTGNISAGNVSATTFTGALSGAATTAGTVTTAAQPNITSVGTLSSLTVTGNASAGNLNTAGAVVASTLTSNVATGTAPLTVTSTTRVANLNVAYANVADLINVTAPGTGTGYVVFANATSGNIAEWVSSGISSNLANNSITATTFVGALSGAATTAGTVTTAAQGNITSVGTLTGLGVNGTITGVNITANTGVFTGNGSGLSQLTGANVTGTVSSATTAGTVTTAAQPNITSVGTLTSVAVTGNVTAGNVYANSGTIGASLLTGTLTTAAQPNVTSVGTLTSLAVTGNISAGNVSATTFTGALSGAATTAGTVTTAAQGNITSVGTLTSLTVSGNISAGNVSATTFTGALSGAATSATTAGTVTTAAQPNITSVGTLTSLGVTGNITAANITANSGVFTGNGSGLSAIAGANVTGAVAFATTANAVAGANVSGQVGNALVAGTVYTNAQPNITSVGTLTSATVSGNVAAGNVYANSGTIGASLLTGTLTTAAQPNITSTGTLTSLTVTGTATAGNLSTGGTLSVTGNANVGNLGTVGLITASGNVSGGNLTTGGLVSATGNIVSSANIVTDLIVGKTTSVTITAAGTNQNINLVPTGTGKVNVGNFIISNVATPVASTDAVNKQYVDDVAQGLHTHDSCNAATQTTLATISGGTVTYNNGTAGVGATLTTTGTFTTIDGVTLSNGMRILVKNEATAANNGIYVRTSATVLTRADDFDTPVEMAGGDFTFVTAGTLYDNTGWVMPDPVTTVGTTAVVWVQFSGAGTYTAGTGLTLTGSQFSVNASQTQITAVGTLGSLAVTGNITAGNVSATTFTGALSGAATTAGTVTTAAQPNITSVGTLTSLAVTGNISAGNVSATTFTGSLSGAATSATTAGTVTTAAQPNITSVGTLTSLAVTGNISAGNVSATTFTGALSGAATTAGTVTTAAQGNITSVGTLTSLGVSGTVTASAFTANTGVFTGNGSGLSAIAGANVTGTVSSATTAGTVTTAAQGNITSVGTLTGLGVNGNITAANITANTGIFSGNGSGLTALNASNISSGTLAQARLANASVTLGSTALTLGSTVTTVAGLSSVTSTTFVGSLSGAATTAGTVTTAAQPNITSVGTLTSLAVTGNVTAGNLIAGAGAGGNITGANLVSANFFTGTLTTAAQPNITSVGTLTSLTTTTITTGANSTAGSMTGNWTLTAGSRFNATYADLAERYVADLPYEPGTVLTFGGDFEVSITGEADSTRVAGVVSTNPAYLMNSECEGEHVVDLALMGRVPCKVIGPIVKGDLITTSEIAGFGKANNEARAGTIIGKALENFNGPTPDGLIEVLVGRS